jgi:hypothetical protein
MNLTQFYISFPVYTVKLEWVEFDTDIKYIAI